MYPIYAIYAPYMAHILSARARARARAPGPRRRGASGPYPQRELTLFPQARAPAK